jgi:hypothetical protein
MAAMTSILHPLRPATCASGRTGKGHGLRMFLSRLLESVTYLFGGGISAPNVPAGPYHPHWSFPSSSSTASSSQPTTTPPSSNSPTRCFSCVYNDLRGGGGGGSPGRYSYDRLRLEFCDTPECRAWGDDVLNRTNADACGAFSAGIGCKLTCSYSVKPDMRVIDDLAGELCSNGRSTGHLPPSGGRER